MGFLGKLTRKTNGFLDKAKHSGNNIFHKVETGINKDINATDKISDICEKALNIGSKVLKGIGTTSNLLGDLWVPGVGLLGDVSSKLGQGLNKGSKILDKYNEKKDKFKLIKADAETKINDFKNGGGLSNITAELPDWSFVKKLWLV